MWKYFTANNTHRYLDALQDFIDSYNNSYHTSIKRILIKLERITNLRRGTVCTEPITDLLRLN